MPHKQRKRRDRDAAQTMRQLSLAFPGLLELVAEKSMEATIYPPRKQPSQARDMAQSEIAGLPLMGMHVTERKA